MVSDIDAAKATDLDQIAQQVRSDTKTYASRLKSASRYAKVCLVLGGALLAGIAQFIPADQAPAPMVLGIVGVLLAFAGGVWILLVDDSVPDALQTAHTAIDRAKSAESSLLKAKAVADSKVVELQAREREFEADRELFEENEQFLSDLYATSLLMNSKVVSEISDADFDEKKSCQNVLDTAVRQIHALLEFEGGEDWTLSIYKAQETEPNSTSLVHIAGQRADRSDEKRDHRAWGVGEGVAGHAFQTGKELIIPNAYDPKAAGWIHVPDRLKLPDDSVKYISFAAIPVMIPSRQTPWGIVIATSDIEDRFETNDDGIGNGGIEPLRMISAQIALLAATAYVKLASSSKTQMKSDSKASTSVRSKASEEQP